MESMAQKLHKKPPGKLDTEKNKQNPTNPPPKNHPNPLLQNSRPPEICINTTSQVNTQFWTEWVFHSFEINNSDIKIWTLSGTRRL